jgi:hypothetical protein
MRGAAGGERMVRVDLELVPLLHIQRELYALPGAWSASGPT